MYKRIVCFIVAIVATVVLASCAAGPMTNVEVKSRGESTSMFVVVEQAPSWKVVYHKTTRVMYVVSDGDYNHGTFTLLVNADGSPMLYSN